jgi:hypothetical protein
MYIRFLHFAFPCWFNHAKLSLALPSKRLVGQAGGDGSGGRPLEREAGHVYVTNLMFRCVLTPKQPMTYNHLFVSKLMDVEG